MGRRYVTFNVIFGLLYFYKVPAVGSSVNANHHGGFRFSQYTDSGVVSLTCSTSFLPDDVTDVWSLSLERRKIRSGSKSHVVASLKKDGE